MDKINIIGGAVVIFSLGWLVGLSIMARYNAKVIIKLENEIMNLKGEK